MTLRDCLVQVKNASFVMSALSNEEKNEALQEFSKLLDERSDLLLKANEKDLAGYQGDKNSQMFQRLKLDRSKIVTLKKGIEDLIAQPDPTGQILSRLQLDDGLILEKQAVPIGVIGIIFESRPDVIPQILSLILKSGNAAVLKGGKEAVHSNHAFMELINELGKRRKTLPFNWSILVDTREDVQEMLKHHDLIDLVVPRGSNQLVQSIMNATKIPVLGHADGVCHLYVHASADLDQAIKIIMDAKTQYPTACNSVETVLIDQAVALAFMLLLEKACQKFKVELRGCDRTRKILPTAKKVENWHMEYSDLIMAIKIVDSIQDAIAHINTHSSHHTDGILARDEKAQKEFTRWVDSASVMVNASTRFADGYRYGMGAEVGISTSKLHARGPVGIEGLVIYKYRLIGSGQVVSDYVGENPKPFQHKRLP